MNATRGLSTILRSASNSTQSVQSVIFPGVNLDVLEKTLKKCRNPMQFFQIQAQMIVSGYIHDAYASSRLVAFAASSKFIDLEHLPRVLLNISSPNQFSWNWVMRACVRRGRPRMTFSLYASMLERGDPCPDQYTHPIVFQACAFRKEETEGKQIHAHVQKFGFSSDVYVVNTMINFYSVCGNIVSARQLFDKSTSLDSVSWNSILSGYIGADEVESAVKVFDKMPERNLIASNSMIAFLARIGRPIEAYRLFEQMPVRDVVSWSAMISCFDQNGMQCDALKMFSTMFSEKVAVDEVVLVSVLSAAARLAAVKEGEMVHGLATKTGIVSYLNLNNALITMYSSFSDVSAAQKLFYSCPHLDQISANSMLSGYLKCRHLDDARRFFNLMPAKDAVSWSTMISGYAQNGQFSEALLLFQEMQIGGFIPDEPALVSILSASAHLTSLKQGSWVHAYVRRRRLSINPILGTALVDMYMKCGCVEDAAAVFEDMAEKGISTWNAMIAGLAANGFPSEALEKFSEMKRLGIAPNEVTFVGALSACRYLGAVAEGQRIFSSMTEEHHIQPNSLHYGCLVDLLAQAGLLRDAEEVIETMPIAPDVATLGALLGACKNHGDLEMGERVGKKMIDLEPDHDGAHVLLFNLYASRGMWAEAAEMRATMKQKNVTKIPGCSLVEAGGTVVEFFSGDGEQALRDPL